MQKYILILSIIISSFSCVKNTLDYPYIFGEILAIELEGQKKVEIDSKARKVLIELEENAEIKHLKIKELKLSNGAVLAKDLGVYLDLSQDLELELKTYQTYKWTISAVQKIKRYVNVEGQVAEASFDLQEKKVTIFVADNKPLNKIRFLSMKLEPQGSEIISTLGKNNKNFEIKEEEESVTFPMELDCTLEREFKVKYKGKEIIWRLVCIPQKVSMSISKINAWCYEADIEGIFDGKNLPVLEYKKDGTEAWSNGELKADGTKFTGKLALLEQGTKYLLRLKDKEGYSEEKSFVTDRPRQIYNINFDEWYENKEERAWYLYTENTPNENRIWDTANKATGRFIGSATLPEDDVIVKGRAVKLQSKWAIVKFAAATLYTGKMLSFDSNGVRMQWGIEFTSRPKALQINYKYEPGVIDQASTKYQNLKGKKDIAAVYAVLADWNDPYLVNSTEEKFLDLEKDRGIIALAKIDLTQRNETYVKEDVAFVYRNDRKPKYIVLVATSSKYGDYFTGSTQSVLYLDEFNLLYR